MSPAATERRVMSTGSTTARNVPDPARVREPDRVWGSTELMLTKTLRIFYSRHRVAMDEEELEVVPTSRFSAQDAVGRTCFDSWPRNAATETPRHPAPFRPRSLGLGRQLRCQGEHGRGRDGHGP